MTRPTMKVTDVTVDLGKTRILSGVTTHFSAGGLIGLIGPNGAGKSTLIRALCKLLGTAQGSIELNGKALGSFSRKALAKQIGYLPQGHVMHWSLEVEQLIALGRLPHLGPFERAGAADQAAIEHAMQAADVTELRRRAADTLSGGERARVMLARVLAAEAPILLADEPVAALDPYHQLHVMELLRTSARGGKLVVCVLHDLPLAARFCDQMVLMHEGGIIADGPTQSVLTPDNLAHAYGIKALYGQDQEETYVLPWQRLGPTAPNTLA